ncbi:unnamed protein product [Closterium sp. NIES-54]
MFVSNMFPGGAEPEGVEPGGAEPTGVEPGGAESGGAEPRGTVSSGGPAGASPRLSPQQLCEWLVRCARLRTGATGAGGAGDTGAGGAGVPAKAGGPGGAAAAGPRGARTGGTGAAGTGGVGDAVARDPTEPRGAGVGGTGAGGAGAAGAGAVDPGPGGAGGTVRPRPYFVPLLRQSSGLTKRYEPVSCPVLPVRTSRRVPRPRPPPVPGTHAMALRPSSVPLCVLFLLLLSPLFLLSLTLSLTKLVLPVPLSLVFLPLLSLTLVVASALVAELLDIATACHLDYATALVAESTSASPPSVGGECALGTDVLEDRHEDFECLAAAVPHFASMLLAPEGDPDAPDIPTSRSYAEAITGSYSSLWQAPMDAEMASWKSTGTYVDEVPPPGANIVDGMWIFRVKRPPGSPPSFKARYVARGFSQRQGVEYFQTFSPTPKMTTLRVLLHVAAHRDYELQGSLHEEIWLCRPLGFTGSFLAGPLALRLPVLLATAHSSVYRPLALGSTFERVHRAELSVPIACGLPHAPKGALGCGEEGVALLVQYVGHGAPAWRTGSSCPHCSSCEAEIYAGAMAAQELRWLTYLLMDLGEQPRSPPVLYVDIKAMIALCQEHRLEHRTKHIPLRYFLARELQQRGQLRIAYVATRANTADVFTKALPSGDHQRFTTVLGLVPTLPHLLTA